MINDGENVVILYLEDWQKRMIHDFLGVHCDHWHVPVEVAMGVMYGAPTVEGATNLKYGVPTETPVKSKRMYLTNWQMRELRDEAGVTCDFIELTKGLNVRYGVKS
jgi:hypothetical protein